jgi:hypothetical protein
VYDQHRELMMARQYLRNSHAGRALAYNGLGRHGEAVQELDRVVELSPEQEQPVFRAARAAARVQAGQVAEAVAEVAELAKRPWPAEQWVGFAQIYAVASTKCAAKKQEHAARAMEMLHQAVRVGYNNAAQLKQDTELAPLRGRDDFQQLIQELEKKSPAKSEKQP